MAHKTFLLVLALVMVLALVGSALAARDEPHQVPGAQIGGPYPPPAMVRPKVLGGPTPTATQPARGPAEDSQDAPKFRPTWDPRTPTPTYEIPWTWRITPSPTYNPYPAP